MTKDIVERLRDVFHNDRSVELMNREAANEIERLRVELDGAHLAYRGACYDRDRIKAERDDARALYCGVLEAYKRGDGREEAKKRGWFCFENKP